MNIPLPDNDKIKKAIVSIAEQNNRLNGGSPSAWFTVDHKGETDIYLRQPCHAAMCRDKPGSTDLVTAAPTRVKLSLEYFQWLIHGPFRSFADLINLEIEPTLKEYYFHCADLAKWPANVLYNFCIATRVPIEHNWLLERWGKLRSFGVDENLAWLITHNMNAEIKAENISQTIWDMSPKWYPNNRGHYWLDATASWTGLITGEMSFDNFSPSYSLRPTYCCPCNTIWGYGGKDDLTKYGKLTVEELSKNFGLTTNRLEGVVKPKRASRAKKVAVEEDPFGFGVAEAAVGWRPNLNQANFAQIPVGFDGNPDPGLHLQGIGFGRPMPLGQQVREQQARALVENQAIFNAGALQQQMRQHLAEAVALDVDAMRRMEAEFPMDRLQLNEEDDFDDEADVADFHNDDNDPDEVFIDDDF